MYKRTQKQRILEGIFPRVPLPVCTMVIPCPSLMEGSERQPLADGNRPPRRQRRTFHGGGGLPALRAGTHGSREAAGRPLPPPTPGGSPAPRGAQPEGVSGRSLPLPPPAPAPAPAPARRRRSLPPLPREAAALTAALCHSPSDCHSHFRRYYQR